MAHAIHITGASGSGTTALGRALAAATGVVPLDTDDFYWAPVEPKYSVKREAPERVRLLDAAFDAAGARGWILSGSVGNDWAAPITPRFRHVIFLQAPAALRIARLRRREADRFGAAAIGPGGPRHAEHEAFLRWAAAYDDGSEPSRSLRRHQTWLAALGCPVLRLDGSEPLPQVLAACRDWLNPTLRPNLDGRPDPRSRT